MGDQNGFLRQKDEIDASGLLKTSPALFNRFA